MLSTNVAILIVVLGLLMSVFGSLAEAAILSTNRLRIRQLVDGGQSKAAAVDQLLRRPRQVLSSIVFISTVGTVLTASVGSAFFVEWLGGAIGLWSLVIGVIVIGTFHLVIGEIIPKAIAGQWPERTALLLAEPVDLVSRLLGPIVGGLEAVTGLFLRPFGWRGDVAAPLVSEEELRLLLNFGQEQGIIEPDEREMIRGVFELEDTTVREVMCPRVDIVAVEVNAGIREAVRLIIERGYSRLPVYEGTIDSIVGIAYAKDLLAALYSGRPATLRGIARRPYLIPENLRIDELLHDLQRRRVHMAIVIDEYGGTQGLVTIEDLLEEIVGEIRDEYDREEETFVRVGPGEAIVSGLVTLDELNEITGLHFEDPDVDTVGGFVTTRLGRLPAAGDEIEVDGAVFHVESITGHRVLLLRARWPEAAPIEDETVTESDPG